MLTLHDDAFIKLGEFLTDKEKIYLTMVSATINKLKYKFIYRTNVELSRIENLPYFDNFENITVANAIDRLPRLTKYLIFLPDKPFDKKIPATVTHLIFGHNFDQPINRDILSNITHLTFGHKFNQEIAGNIPSSVKYLKLGTYFDKQIPLSISYLSVLCSEQVLSIRRHNAPEFDDDGELSKREQKQIRHIPSKRNEKCNITYLELDGRGVAYATFDRPTKNYIPSSVTHLTFKKYSNMSIDLHMSNYITHLEFDGSFNAILTDIPSSVVQIVLDKEYPWRIDHIPSRVKIIYN